jgi:cytochrome c oxidase subunit 2
MRRTRLGLVALAGVLAAALLSTPAAAQSSTTAGLINDLNLKLLYIAVPITLIVELILLYTVVRFRNNDEPVPTQENRRLEITWTIATAIILLFVGVASYGVLASPDVTHPESASVAPEEGDVQVRAEAYQWGWSMSYPEENVSVGGTEPTIVVPKGEDVYFTVTSRDVIHGFAVPELGLKQDAIPDQEITIKTTPLETGTFQGYCTEYCGVSHSQMYFTVKVVPQDQYQQFIEEQQGGGGNASAVAEPTAPVAGGD